VSDKKGPTAEDVAAVGREVKALRAEVETLRASISQRWKPLEDKLQEMAQQTAQMEATVKGLDKSPGMLYDGDRKVRVRKPRLSTPSTPSTSATQRGNAMTIRKAALAIAAAAAIFSTAPATAQMTKFDDCMAEDQCKLEAAMAVCGDKMNLKVADIDRVTRGTKSYYEFNKKVGPSCGKRITEASPDGDDEDEADEPRVQKTRYAGGPYQGDRDLLRLRSLGPNGRVITGRRAPMDAIPCVVKGVRGRCVPK
jgi:hypothetical protein